MSSGEESDLDRELQNESSESIEVSLSVEKIVSLHVLFHSAVQNAD